MSISTTLVLVDNDDKNVFGSDINIFKNLGFENSDCNKSHDNNSKLYSKKGDLFGALIGRKVDTDSRLYQSQNLFNLSIPHLIDSEAPELFTPKEIIEDHTYHSDILEFQNEANEVASPYELEHKAVDVSAPQYNNPLLSRPYFSVASQAEFSDVLNGTDTYKYMCIILYTLIAYIVLI
jgi:hypothetical protein